MNKKLFYIAPLLFAQGLFAQDAIFLQRSDSTSLLDSTRNMIVLNGNYNFDSNSLYNDLTNGLRYAREISRDVRDRSRDALQPENRVGSEIDLQLTYRHFGDSLFGTERLGWQVRLGHHEVIGVKFTKDLYNLTFYGNKQYENETAYMDGSNELEMKYQKIGFGIFDKHTLSSATISFVKGQNYALNDLRKANLYTAPEGVYLDFELEGTLESSDSTNKSIEHFNGFGAALDFEWNVPLSIAGRPNYFSQLSLAVRDLGFVAWNDQSHRTTPDTTIHFEGVTVDDIFNLDDVIINEDDLLDSLGIHIENTSITRMLPVDLQLALRSRFHNKWYGEVGLRYRDLRSFVPHVWLNVSYLPREQFRLTFLSGYGGFGGFRIGIGTEVMFSERWYLLARTSNLIGSISENARGQQVQIGFSALF